MHRTRLLFSSLFTAIVLHDATSAQVLVTTDANTDKVVAFSPVDGSLLGTSVLDIPNLVQWAALEVNGEIWLGEQLGDRIVRYDRCGNVLGSMGPTFPGGGLDNIRGMTLIGGLVYVCNDGSGNGATPDSLVCFDTTGNWVQTLPLAFSPSPFCVLPWQGDILVSSSSAGDDVHRYTLAGTSVGTFHDSTGLDFANQLSLASDGNVWCCPLTSSSVVKLDATTGAIVQSFPGGSGRGVYELQNGNVLWTSTSGVRVYDTSTMTSSLVFAGNCYHVTLLNLPPSLVYACHESYGAGCHSFVQDNSNLFQLFTDVPAAKAALDGNAIRFTLTGNGYVANWLPGVAGALYVPPSGTATIVANVSTGQETFTPSAVIPIPGGVTATWTLSSEGILTAGSTGNQGTDTTPSLADTASAAGLAFYTWYTQNPAETGSGKFKWEEVSGTLYVTAEGVELSGGTPTLSPATYQWQVDTTTGDVTMVWVSMPPSTSTSDVLVGCTLAGTGITPVSQTLSTGASALLQPDLSQSPMTLSASPFPIINPSTTVTYTASNAPEFSPGSGIYIGTMFLSVNPLPGGFDLQGILTTVPGCNAYLSTLDIDLGGTLNVLPTLTWGFTYSNAFFAPGNVVAAQAVALFDSSFPLLNGEAGGFLLSNGVLSTTELQ